MHEARFPFSPLPIAGHVVHVYMQFRLDETGTIYCQVCIFPLDKDTKEIDTNEYCMKPQLLKSLR